MSWSDKYKKSINCDNPKGFSQRAHCQGRKKKLDEEGLRKWFQSKSKDGKPGWVDVVDGDACAREKGETATPKCVSSEKRASMSKKERLAAQARKRRKDPNQPEKSGASKPTYVKTDYTPKGNMDLQEVKDKPGKGSGKKDACYNKVKSRYDVWPSAYASGALVKCRKVGAANWGTKSEGKDHEYSMARSEISTIVAAAKRLKKKVGKGEGDLEAWVQSKITKAADYIDTAADYVSSREHNESIDIQTADGKTFAQFIDIIGPNQMQAAVNEKCWVGYKQLGMKKKGDRMVPNCVKEAIGVPLPEPTDRAAKDQLQKMIPKGEKVHTFGSKLQKANFELEGEENIQEIHGQGHSPHEVPSGNIKRLVKKASKRVDADADGDIDTLDKAKGEVGKFASDIKNKKIYDVAGARKVPKKSLSSYEIPSGDLKKLVAKAVKRIDTDVDGDSDNNDKSKGELGEFIPGVNNKRLFSTTRTKTTKESFSNWRQELEEDWQKVNKSDKTDGMSPAAVKAYRRENPGSKLKTAVTGDPKSGSKDAKRRKSFCSRSKGQQDMHNIDCSKDPDKAICKARRRWKC